MTRQVSTLNKSARLIGSSQCEPITNDAVNDDDAGKLKRFQDHADLIHPSDYHLRNIVHFEFSLLLSNLHTTTTTSLSSILISLYRLLSLPLLLQLFRASSPLNGGNSIVLEPVNSVEVACR
jgi:hypothetical protein